MKRCPKCNRTYADDAFTFCLEDGALLSASYNPNDEPTSTIQTSGPPPTVIFSQTEHSAPTVASDESIPDTSETKTNPGVSTASGSESQKNVWRRYIVMAAIAVVILVGVSFLGIYTMTKVNCPDFVIHCRSIDESMATCRLVEAGENPWVDLGYSAASTVQNDAYNALMGNELNSRSVILLQMPTLPPDIAYISWSASAGQNPSAYEGRETSMNLNTSGLSGKTITITAVVTGTRRACSTSVTTTFVVPLF